PTRGGAWPQRSEHRRGIFTAQGGFAPQKATFHKSVSMCRDRARIALHNARIARATEEMTARNIHNMKTAAGLGDELLLKNPREVLSRRATGPRRRTAQAAMDARSTRRSRRADESWDPRIGVPDRSGQSPSAQAIRPAR